MKEKLLISDYGIFATVVVTVVGVGIFSYPREITNAVGTDGWLMTIIGGLISLLLSLLIYKIIKDNEYDNFYEMLKNNLGVFLGFVFGIVFVFHAIFTLSIGMRVFIEVIKMYLLHNTPTEFLIVVTILVGIYIVRGDLGVLLKFNEIAFWLMFLPIIIVLIFTLNNVDFSNILPIFNNEFKKYIYSINTTIYSFQGFEVLYVLLPFAKKSETIKKTIIKSIVFITFFYILIVIFTIAVFSKEQTKILLWPTITMITSIDIPGAFIERWQGVVMSMWILFYFTTFINYLYIASDVLKSIFNLRDVKISSALLIPFIYAIALFPKNISELYGISKKYVPIFFTINFLILPIVLWIGTKLRKRGGGEVSEN